jgi:acylphosphatase
MSEPTAPHVRRRVVVRGQVQGVWFRESTRRLAERHGVAGWIQNRADGAVEGIFEGDDDAVARLVDFCRLGPQGAVVAGLDETDEPPAGLCGFTVR